MKAKCILCDRIDTLNDDTLQAKKLRNRPIHTYMCPACHDRISERTEQRIATGNFRLYRSPKIEEDF